MGKTRNIILQIICFPIRVYQYCISPWLGSNCRFYPSCSNYTLQALRQFGIVNGAFLSIKRLLRCHPFSKGGYDPVIKDKEKFHG